MSKYLHTLVFLFTAHLLIGQGWERIYSGGGNDEAHDVAITPDGGYILAGTYLGSNLQLTKVDADGFLQWSNFTLVGPQTTASAVKVLADSSFLVVGSKWTSGNGGPGEPSMDGFLFKTDFFGNVLWTKNIGVVNKSDDINDLVVLSDGSLVMIGNDYVGDQMRIVKTDAEGNLLWSKTFGLAGDIIERGNDLTIAENGDIVAVGYRRKDPNIQDIYLVRVTASDGVLVWETAYSATGTDIDESGHSITTAPGGGFIVGGFTEVPNTSFRGGLLVKVAENPVLNPAPVWILTFFTAPDSIRAYEISDVSLDGTGGYVICGRTPEAPPQYVRSEIYLARVDVDGTLIWENKAGKAGLSEGFAVSPTSDGQGFVAVGYTYTTSDPFSQQRYAYMVRSDFEGNFFTNYLSGKLYNDLNNDCEYQLGEPGLNKWLLRVSSPDFTRYVNTDAQGNYFVMVDTGVYDVKVFPSNTYWGSCLPSLSIPVTSFFDTTKTDIGIKKITSCPFNEVDIQTPILRRCVDNPYTVRYCNSGTVPSQNTLVYVEKSPGFAISSSSLPYTTAGDTLIFSVGTVNPGDCGSFTINAFLDCNAELSSAHCMRAHITPDSFCDATNWNGSMIEARAICENDTVKLSLINKGTGSANGLEYVIVDDVILLFAPPNYSGFVQSLNPSQDTLVFSRPANGHTYRLISEQAATYPGLSIPTAAVEGCKTDTTTTFSTGFYTMFPEDDAEPFAASDCQETYEASFNPTFLKRGHPKGYKDPHYIYPNTDVDYLIHFQNTGSDTISQVIVRDTLSSWLDPSTVRPGTASHPYTYSVYGDGIVSFQLTNINLLPAGSSSSEGFIKFRVSQKPGVPCDTQLLNRAAIYFDFNAPVETNETYHTVCDSFIELEVVDTTTNGTNISDFPGAGLRIYPNPFVSSTTLEVTGVNAASFHLELYDAQGRLIFNQTQADSTFRLFRHQISSGFMIYRLVADGRPVASGKIMVR